MIRGRLPLARLVGSSLSVQHTASLRQQFATAHVPSIRSSPRVGDKLHGFTVQRTRDVPELESSIIQLQHDETGADYLHVTREDKNNVFAIGFKTNPNDDTGVPHILEHTTLCGSQKYPVRDPFFKMLNRSLSNFMNAFTSSDHTTYPFATTNQVDFNNLMDVYMDATLAPLLKESDFKQEGWRIGPENPNDPCSPMLFKGVVYNEMKGQMSDSSYHYYIRFHDHIFPALHNSGGDPAKITELSIEQLRKFHKDHYNPSNSKIFTYGDIPVERHLALINEKLQGFGRAAVDARSREPLQLAQSHSVTMPGPVDPLMDPSAQIKTSLSWITNSTANIGETFALRILSTYLLDGYGSSLYRGLIDEKLGSDFSPNTGFDTSSSKGILSIGLQNIRQEDLQTVHDRIPHILCEVHNAGFEGKKVEGILHQLELALKHKTATFGVSMMQSLMPAWFNGVDPFDMLLWNTTVSKFRERFSNGGYLESLMKKYILDANKFTFTMLPTADFSTNLAAEEGRRLGAAIQRAGGDTIHMHLREQELGLQELQEQTRGEDASCLPTLYVSDIPRQMERKPLRLSSIDGVPIQWRSAPTNGIIYFRAVNHLDSLPEDLRLYLPLFTDSVLRLGTQRKSMEELENQIKLKTGGIRVGTHVWTNHTNLEVFDEGLVFSGFCLDENLPDMLDLFRTVLLETNFKAVSKLRTLIHGTASGFISDLAESGHDYTRTFAGAHLTPASRAIETIEGVTQVKLISGLATKEIYNEALEKIQTIARFAARKNGLRIAVTCSPTAEAASEKIVARFINSLPSARSPIRQTTLSGFQVPVRAFFPMPYQVSYASMCLKTVPYTHKDSAALGLLSQLLTHKYLHHEIREKGGAYGGGAFHHSTAGIFGFYSYRDPNVTNTLKVMSAAGEYVTSSSWTDRDLEEAKMSVFQSLDAPTSVSEDGMIYFLDNITDPMRQRRREQLLDASVLDIQEVADKYLNAQITAWKTATAVLGKGQDIVGPEWTVFPLQLDTCVPSAPILGQKIRL